jgi:hypothetical protein
MAHIPLTYPVTNAADDEPILTQSGWIALCIAIAQKDLTNLDMLFQTASKLRASQ